MYWVNVFVFAYGFGAVVVEDCVMYGYGAASMLVTCCYLTEENTLQIVPLCVAGSEEL